MSEMKSAVLEAAENMTGETETSGKKGISGSTLKLIAIITMFIDHAGAIIVERMLMGGIAAQGGLMPYDRRLWIFYLVLRFIGRLGFPIFCYLLIEGFQHTRNVKKYAGRLFLFALISEVPFDLGFIGTPFYWGYQNVFFTLFIGLLVIIGIHFAEEKEEWNTVLRILFSLLVTVAGAFLALLLKTDYDAVGVITIAVMYRLRKRRMLETGIGCAILTLSNLMEVTAFFIMIPVHLYNGKRGWNIKWLFYAFYPVHILLLYLIALAMGLGDIMLR